MIVACGLPLFIILSLPFLKIESTVNVLLIFFLCFVVPVIMMQIIDHTSRGEHSHD
jgi:hypothetical protein